MCRSTRARDMTCDLVMDRLSGDGGGKLRALVLNKMSKYEGQGETHTAHTSVVSIHNSCSSNDRGCARANPISTTKLRSQNATFVSRNLWELRMRDDDWCDPTCCMDELWREKASTRLAMADALPFQRLSSKAQ